MGILAIVVASISQPVFALKPDTKPQTLPAQHTFSVDEIARKINNQQWRILAAEPKVDEIKLLYRFKLLNKKRGRVKVIVIDPTQPDIDNLN